MRYRRDETYDGTVDGEVMFVDELGRDESAIDWGIPVCGVRVEWRWISEGGIMLPLILRGFIHGQGGQAQLVERFLCQ